MSEKTTSTGNKRTIDQVNQDYSQCAAKLGDLIYKSKIIPKQMEDLHDQMKALDQEALEIKHQELKKDTL